MNLLLADIVDYLNSFAPKPYLFVDSGEPNYNRTFKSFVPLDESNHDSISYMNEMSGIRPFSMKGLILVPTESLEYWKQWCFEHPETIIIFVENPRLWYLRLVKTFYQGYIADQIQIGTGCKIDPYTVIGEDGYGYERNENGEPELFLHMGGVKIGDRVDIGSFTTIDKALFHFTTIGDGSKIDAQCHIGHNVQMGKRVMMTAGAVIGGSVKIGDNCYFGLSATVNDHVTLGHHCIIGNGANIRKNWDDGCVVYGNDIFLGFATDKHEWRRLVGL